MAHLIFSSSLSSPSSKPGSGVICGVSDLVLCVRGSRQAHWSEISYIVAFRKVPLFPWHTSFILKAGKRAMMYTGGLWLPTGNPKAERFISPFLPKQQLLTWPPGNPGKPMVPLSPAEPGGPGRPGSPGCPGLPGSPLWNPGSPCLPGSPPLPWIPGWPLSPDRVGSVTNF